LLAVEISPILDNPTEVPINIASLSNRNEVYQWSIAGTRVYRIAEVVWDEFTVTGRITTN
jgi:hypothetical protein